MKVTLPPGCLCIYMQPIAFGEPCFQSQNSSDHLVLYVSFATFRWKRPIQVRVKNKIE